MRAQLDSHGRFPAIVVPDTLLSQEQARALATAFLNTLTYGDPPLGLPILYAIEQRHGREIAWSQVVMPLSYVVYAQAPYGLTEEAGPFIRRITGPRVLLAVLSSSGRQIASISVSARCTHLNIVAGFLDLSQSRNGCFFITGVPFSSEYSFPLSAEYSVQGLARSTGVRIADVPELIAPPRPVAPQLSLWRLVLEEPVEWEMVATGERVWASEVFMRSERRDGEVSYLAMLRAAPVQPESYGIQDPETDLWLEIPRQPGYPLAFEELVFEGW